MHWKHYVGVLTLSMSYCGAQPALAAPTVVNDLVTKVSDGDTLRIKTTWKGLPISIRVYGIDTPEHDYRAQCAEEREFGVRALNYAKSIIDSGGGKVRLTIFGWDKFGGRVLATVEIKVNGKTLNFSDEMIKAGFARPYYGDAKGNYWCKAPVIEPIGDVETLKG